MLRFLPCILAFMSSNLPMQIMNTGSNLRRAALIYACGLPLWFSGCLLLLCLLVRLGAYHPQAYGDWHLPDALAMFAVIMAAWQGYERFPQWLLRRLGYSARQVQCAKRLYRAAKKRTQWRTLWLPLCAFAMALLMAGRAMVRHPQNAWSQLFTANPALFIIYLPALYLFSLGTICALWRRKQP